MCRLFKEVVELASTQARISRTKGSLADIERTLTLELADVMAWTIALANYYGLDLGEFFLFRLRTRLSAMRRKDRVHLHRFPDG